MEHLVKQRGYTCIKYLCINNEPGAGFSWWNAPPNRPLSIKPGLEAVRKALDRRGLKGLPLSGPDYTNGGFPVTYPAGVDFLPILGAYDFHDYDADFDFRAHGHITQQERNAALWTRQAHAEGKPLFLSEFGTMAYGWVPDMPGPSCPQAALAGAEFVVRMLECGVDGMNRWSFLNRGDLDGQWQLVDTWDRKTKRLLKEFTPHADSYFCLGLLPRFIAKHSTVLGSRVNGGRIDPWQRVFAVALRSPGGDLTVAVVNDASRGYDLELAVDGLAKSARFYRYRYDETCHGKADLRIDPQKEFSLGPHEKTLRDALPPSSLTIFSTFKLAHDDPGVIASDGPWQVRRVFRIGGTGGFDYLTVDSQRGLLYVPRTTHTMVVEAATGKVTADIPGQRHNHGVAIAGSLSRGFISDGGDGSVVVFDIKTNRVLGKVKAAADADAIIYDPESRKVLVSCGGAGAIVPIPADIDPATGTADAAVVLGGKPESLVAADGKAYVNLVDKNQVAAIDIRTAKVIHKWPTAPGGGPVGMAIDTAHHRLFIACRKPQKLIVMNSEDGTVLADLPIGAGADAAQFDGDAFVSCRDGTLAVVCETSPGKFAIVQTVHTRDGAKTMGCDVKTHTLYLPTAEFGRQKEARSRPIARPDSFMILVVGRST